MKTNEQDLEMYQAALQLEYPWYVIRKEFDLNNGQLDIYLDFDRKGNFICATCGAENQPFYDIVVKATLGFLAVYLFSSCSSSACTLRAMR